MPSQTAYERIIGALRDRGSRVNERRDKAQCPAHDDDQPSLSISPRRDGKGILIKCHAGCDYQAVLTALGMSTRDLFDDAGMRGIYSARRDYRYPDGRVVHRTPGKKFWQENAEGRRSLFRTEFGAAETVFVAEGEKDVLAVESVGGAATCSAMGAGKADRFDWEPLRGKTVIVIADKDEPGRKHAEQVVGLLQGIASSIHIVEAAAGKDAADHIAAGYGLDELVTAPTAEVVDGAELLDQIERFAGRFLAFASGHHLTVVVLWVVHTWAVSAFYVTPRLVLDSPEPGSGKTRVLEVLALLCRNAKLTLSTTTAALYRRIAAAGDEPPTILQDEADAVFGRTTNPQSEDLRALFNAGYKRGATVDRCEGDAKNMKVREFPVFAPVALAGLSGKMPATITDRAVTLHMRRRAPDEPIGEFRERDAAIAAAPLRKQIEAWATANLGTLSAARPAMPEGVRDRQAEVWEALLAVADVAGGQWTERAQAACRYFVLDTDCDDKLSLGVRLLRDIKTVFGDLDRMFSADIVFELTRDPESDWCDLWGKPLDQRRLAKELKRYGVRSKEVRIGTRTAKGYAIDEDDGLGQAWHRYLPHVGGRNKRDKGNIAGRSVADVSRTEPERNKRNTSATAEICSELGVFGSVADVADVAHKNGMATNGHSPHCRDCGEVIAEHMYSARARGVCTRCTAKVTANTAGTR